MPVRGNEQAARAYLRDWAPDHVLDYIAEHTSLARAEGVAEGLERAARIAETTECGGLGHDYDYGASTACRSISAAIRSSIGTPEVGKDADGWQPIETAPKDRSILLFWPDYRYNDEDHACGPQLAIGCWKDNPRIGLGYFSDSGEWDDYGLAKWWPTHWHSLPAAPTVESAPQ